MKLTLRQAHKLVEKITAKIGALNVAPTREVNVYEAKGNTFSVLAAELDTNLGRLDTLIDARYRIRELIGQANQLQVDGLIAKRKYLLDKIGVKRTLVAGVRSSHVSSQSALESKVETMAAGAAAGGRSGLYGDDTITINLISDSQVEALNAEIDQLQLLIEGVEDDLTAANANPAAAVVLPDHVLAALVAEGIVAK